MLHTVLHYISCMLNKTLRCFIAILILQSAENNVENYVKTNYWIIIYWSFAFSISMQHHKVSTITGDRRLSERAYRRTFDQIPSLRTIPPMSLVKFNAPNYCLINDRIRAVYCFVVNAMYNKCYALQRDHTTNRIIKS